MQTQGLASSTAYQYNNLNSTTSQPCNTLINGTIFTQNPTAFYQAGGNGTYATTTQMQTMIASGIAVALIGASSKAFMQY